MSLSADARAGAATAAPVITYRQAIVRAMADAMEADPSVLLLGEDVAAAGGVFKTSDGLLDRFGPRRVIDTPICENSFVGMALGMACTGLRPVVEIMFSDFLLTAADAIINEVAKFRFMSGGQFRVPLTIRTIGGGGGRFGAQHSATGESWFLQVPGLRVVTLGTTASAYALLRAAIEDDNPTMVIEHKGMYGLKEPEAALLEARAEVGRSVVLRPGSDVTIVATLAMVQRGLEAARRLEAEGISCEVIDLRWIAPLDERGVAESVGRTGRLLVVEEQLHAGGWGATLISAMVRAGVPFAAPPQAVSMTEGLPLPFSGPLEDQVLPSTARIVDAARALTGSGTAP